MKPSQQQRMTENEYLEMIRDTGKRYDYIDGQIYDMSGGTFEHSAIISGLTSSIDRRLSQKSCQWFGSDLAVKIAARGNYVFPDLSVVCGKPQIERSSIDFLLNPITIFEVLSKSTATYDLVTKARYYQMMESLQEVVYIKQDEPLIQILRRRDGAWSAPDYVLGLGAELQLPSLDIAIPLKEIYDRIEFPDDPTPEEGELRG